MSVRFLSPRLLPSLVLVVCLSPGVALAAQEWLTRMVNAADTLNYDGLFVYQHGERLQSMRIVHRVDGGVVRERLVSLGGAGREIIRKGGEVRCYLPDQNSVMIEHRQPQGLGFPALLSENPSNLDKYYEILADRVGRVAGRSAQHVIIRPRDEYRYGYRLWADRDTGLLLKASVIDSNDKVIEQFMFTQVRIGGTIPDAALEVDDANRKLITRRASVESPPLAADAEPRWEASELPPGFVLRARTHRLVDSQRAPFEHVVYSDGLAVVSVFVEERTEGAADQLVTGATQRGATHVFGRTLDRYQVTVVGDVPAPTVSLIGAGIQARP